MALPVGRKPRSHNRLYGSRVEHGLGRSRPPEAVTWRLLGKLSAHLAVASAAAPARPDYKSTRSPNRNRPMLMRSPLARDRRSPPGFIRPALPVLATKVPAGDGWPHELKHDGFRIVAHKDGDEVRLWSRNGRNWVGRDGRSPPLYGQSRSRGSR